VLEKPQRAQTALEVYLFKGSEGALAVL